MILRKIPWIAAFAGLMLGAGILNGQTSQVNEMPDYINRYNADMADIDRAFNLMPDSLYDGKLAVIGKWHSLLDILPFNDFNQQQFHACGNGAEYPGK